MAPAGGMLRFYEKEGEYVTIEQLLDWVRSADHRLPDGRCVPVCVWGSRGSGKTSQISSFCRQRNLDLKVYHPAHDVNGQDIVGQPEVDPKTGKVTFALPEWLPQDEDTEGIWFIDEINRATEEVLAGLMEPIGEGTISQSNWSLPRGWQIVVAANPSETGYQVQSIDDAMVDRMLHYNPGWEASTWATWAKRAGIADDIVDFALRRTEQIAIAKDLGEFQLPREIEEKMVASPRSLTYFAALYEPGMPESLSMAIGNGLIGREATASFLEMVSMEERPIGGSEILEEPRLGSSGDMYSYDERLARWNGDVVNGDELIKGSLQNLAVALLSMEWPSGLFDEKEGRYRPAIQGETQVRPAEEVQENRPAQLAGRFLAHLTSEQREHFWSLLSRMAPHWHGHVHEATMLWLKSVAPRQIQQGSPAR